MLSRDKSPSYTQAVVLQSPVHFFDLSNCVRCSYTRVTTYQEQVSGEVKRRTIKLSSQVNSVRSYLAHWSSLLPGKYLLHSTLERAEAFQYDSSDTVVCR